MISEDTKEREDQMPNDMPEDNRKRKADELCKISFPARKSTDAGYTEIYLDLNPIHSRIRGLVRRQKKNKLSLDRNGNMLSRVLDLVNKLSKEIGDKKSEPSSNRKELEHKVDNLVKEVRAAKKQSERKVQELEDGVSKLTKKVNSLANSLAAANNTSEGKVETVMGVLSKKMDDLAATTTTQSVNQNEELETIMIGVAKSLDDLVVATTAMAKEKSASENDNYAELANDYRSCY